MKYLEKCCKIFLKYKLCILKLLPRGLEVLVQLVENTEIVKPDIHDQGSIPSHSSWCVWVYDDFVISFMYQKKSYCLVYILIWKEVFVYKYLSNFFMYRW
jgi:hypothetical protein